MPHQSLSAFQRREDDHLDLVLTRRLRNLSRSPLTASLAFDYAAGLDDDIAEAAADFGFVPQFTRRNAVGDFVNKVVFEQVPQLGVTDLKKFQQRLLEQGYLPSDYEPTGRWDDVSASAARRFGFDQGDLFRQGRGNPLGITTEKAFEILDATLPRRVFQGLVGGFRDMGKSFLSTAKRWSALTLIREGFGAISDRQGYVDKQLAKVKHVPEDALNVLTLLGMATGASELGIAGRALLGAAGKPLGREAAKRFGFAEASALARPPAERLLAQAPSLSTRFGASVLRKFSNTAGDSFSTWVKLYGPRAQSQRPVLRVAGQAYSGLSKAAIGPNLAGIFNPDSDLGKAVNESPQLPWWTDLSTLVVVPQSGLVPRPRDLSKHLTKRSFGAIDPWKMLGLETPDDLSRAATYVQAYANFQGLNAAQTSKSWAKAVRSGPGFTHRLEREAISKEISKALIDPRLPQRGVNQSYWEQAVRWGTDNPEAVAAYVRSIHTRAQTREKLGLVGFNPEASYRDAELLGKTATDDIALSVGRFNELAESIGKVSDDITEATLRFDAGDIEAFGEVDRLQRQLDDLTRQAEGLDVSPVMGDEQLAKRVDNGTFRVLPERWDNPLTKQNLTKWLDEWEAGDETVRAGLKRFFHLIDLGNVPDNQVASNLKALRSVAPTDLSDVLPSSLVDQFRSLGYKPVAGGHNVLLRGDVSDLVYQLPNYSRAGYLWASLGLGTNKVDPAVIGRLANSTTADAWEQILMDEGVGIAGIGRAVLNAVKADQDNVVKASNELMKSGGPVSRMLSRAQTQFFGVRDASVKQIRKVLQTEFSLTEDHAKAVAGQLKKAALESFAHPGLVQSPSHALGILDRVAGSLRIHGWQGLTETLRAMTLSDIKKIGAGPFKVGNLPRFSERKGEWGFLPDHLLKGALKLRFTLNPFFEAMNLSEQQVIRATQFELSPSLRPLKTMQSQGIFEEAQDIFARVHGFNGALDDSERILLQGNIFGYNIRHHAMYDYHRLYTQKVGEFRASGLTPDEADLQAVGFLRDEGWKLLSYGSRTPLEKSVNFVFFPFSFQKKYTNAVLDFFSAQPIRTFTVHELFKRIETLEELDENGKSRLANIIDRHAPVLRELNRLNGFSYGISPGEFGGVFRPLATALGVGMQETLGAFMPVGIRGEDAPKFADLMPRLVPALNSIGRFWERVEEQAHVVKALGTDEAPQAPSSQIDDYYTLLNALEEEFVPQSVMWGGGASIRSMLASRKVPVFVKEGYQRGRLALEERYPAGARHQRESAGRSALRSLTVDEVLRKPNKSRAEQGIVALEAEVQRVSALFDDSQNPVAELIREQMEANSVRSVALRLFNEIGRPFIDLYRLFGYEREFGPVAVEEV